MHHLGRFFVGLVAGATVIAPFIFWFDEFHLGDPDWPPHARAHLVWLLLLVTSGSAMSLATTLFAWERSADLRRVAALYPCLVWGACLLEAHVLSPALGVDVPLTHLRWKVVGNTEANLFGIGAPIVLGIVGLLLDERRRAAR